jgi:hypothetical protein
MIKWLPQALREYATFSIRRHRVSRQDAPRMGVKIVVQEGESIPSALRRLKELMRRNHVSPRVSRRKGPFSWMLVTKEHYQKPSLLKRMKRVRKRLYARRAIYFTRLELAPLQTFGS